MTKHTLTALYDRNLSPITTGFKVGAGYQGAVYDVTEYPQSVAKIFHHLPLDQNTQNKLEFMLDHPPVASGTNTYHVAWPLSIIRRPKRDGKIVGYLMPKFDPDHYHEIGAYLNPVRRRLRTQKRRRGFTYLHLLAIARNLSAAVDKIHQLGHVVGDLNSKNVLVNDSGHVVLIDTDSFQINDPQTRRIHRCTVGTPEYTAPNIQGHEFASLDRSNQDDLFALGVIIYQLLFQGQHPYTGRYVPTKQHRELTNIMDRITNGHFIHNPPRSSPYLPTEQSSLIWDNTPLKRQFKQSFPNNGKAPINRTTAAAWIHHLEQTSSKVKPCRNQPLHHYMGTKSCTWCKYRRLTRIEPFPEPMTVPA